MHRLLALSAVAASGVFSALIAAPIPAQGIPDDVTAPSIAEFEMTPTVIDSSVADHLISVRMRVTDDVSGINSAPTLELRAPELHLNGVARRTDGTALDGWYEWSTTIPRGTAAGAWHVALNVRDRAGNESDAYGPQSRLDNLGTIVSSTATDTEAPAIADFRLSSRIVDVADESAQITLRARVTDNIAGVSDAQVVLVNEDSGGRLAPVRLQRVSGTSLDGWYEGAIVVPRATTAGEWIVESHAIRDERGNTAEQGAIWAPEAWMYWDRPYVTVVSPAQSDTQPPRLDYVDVSPRAAPVGIPQPVQVRMRIADPSGVVIPEIALENELTGDIVGQARMNRTSGDALDGWYEWSATLPADAQAAAWTVTMFPFGDAVGNSYWYRDLDRVSLVSDPGNDRLAPELLAFEPSVLSVDATDTAERLTVRARVVDDRSGARPPVLQLVQSDTRELVHESPMTRSSGSALDGWYEWSVDLSEMSAPGQWQLQMPPLVDAAGNEGYSGAASMFPSIINVVNYGIDRAAPAVTSLSVTPRRYLPETDDASIAVEARVTDNFAGATAPRLVFRAPTGFESVVQTELRSGTPLDGLYAWSGVLEHHGISGTWTAEIRSVADLRGNAVASPGNREVPFEVVLPPEPPASTRATAGSSSAVVTWTAPASSGGAAISSYVVTAAPGGRSVTVPASATTATVTGLTNGTEYRFTVVAVNAAGSSAASSASNAVTPFASLDRLAGANRYATAASIAERFPDGVETVYVASGKNFPDALAGAALAGSQEAPVLLATRSSVPDATLDALETLDPQRIVMLGGTPTLSDAVARQLAAYGTVTRIAGANRYATAAEISEGFAPGVDTVYVASGASFPDALAGAALAGATDSPVLLTSPRELPDSVRDALERLDPTRIVVLGGTPSVNATVFAQLRDYAPATRIAGGNRFETAALVAAQFDTADRVYVASGTKFPDALAGAALAALNDSPVLLTRHDTLSPATATATERLDPAQVVVLGDHNSVNNNVAAQLQALIN